MKIAFIIGKQTNKIFLKISFTMLCLALMASGYSQQKPITLWFNKPAYQPAVFSYNAKEFKEVFQFE